MFKKPQYNTFEKSGSAKAFNAPVSDHLVTIEDYDIEKHQIHGTNHMGKKGVYKISVEAYNRFESKAGGMSGAKFFGHKIDDKMQTAIKIGRKVVTRSNFLSNKKNISPKD